MATTLLGVSALTAATACGDVGGESATTSSPTKLTIVDKDYDFRAPETVRGGLVEFTFKNDEEELHFAGLAHVLPGRSAEEVHVALTQSLPAARSGPLPFEDFAAIAATGPGQTAKVTLNVPPAPTSASALFPRPTASPTPIRAAWFGEPTGSRRGTFLGGVALRPGEDGAATLQLKSGSMYAFVCTIPDAVGDGAPHLAKGMVSAPFTVR